MRLLVLDGSRMLPSLVRRLVPPGVTVESAASFAEARERLARRPPQALIVNLTPVELPWRELQRLCEEHIPPIPVLYESCVHASPREVGLESPNGSWRFLSKPYPLASLEAEIARLLEAAGPEGEPGGTVRRPRPRL